jgi:hypothetical protein
MFRANFLNLPIQQLWAKLGPKTCRLSFYWEILDRILGCNGASKIAPFVKLHLLVVKLCW